MDKKLTLQDLADALAIKEGITKKKSDSFIKALFETIEEGLLADKFVKIKGLGTFKIISVGERESVNINTGERFSIEGHERITFTPDTTLKELVNRPFAHFQTVIINEETNLDELGIFDDSEDIDDKNNLVTSGINSEDDIDLDNENDIESKDTYVTIEKQKESPLDKSSRQKNENTVENQQLETSEKLNNEGSNCQNTNDGFEDSDKKGNRDNESNASTEKLLNPNEQIVINPEKEKSKEATWSINTQEIQSPTSQPMEKSSITSSSNTPKEDEENNEKNLSTGEMQQQITYIIKDLESKRNIWKIVSLILLAILLLILSYFAGYFRWFCPCDTPSPLNSSIISVNNPKDLEPHIVKHTEVQTTIKDSLNQSKDSLKLNKTAFTQDINNTSEILSESTNKNIDESKEQEISDIPHEKKENETIPLQSLQYTQVPGGKYKIVGTLKTHKIQNGETIRTIAHDVYGSKGYAIYIITHNNLKNPNIVGTGTILNLPKLERRKK